MDLPINRRKDPVLDLSSQKVGCVLFSVRDPVREDTEIKLT